MEEVKCTVRPMKREEAPQALDVWRETGMHQGTHSLYSWMEVDPESIQVAVTDQGEVIGVCAATLQHDDLCFVGIYCVRKKYRGLGIGLKVWNACMEHVGSRNVCLNAVPGKLSMYRDKGGFPIVEQHWTTVENETTQSAHPEYLSDIPPQGVELETLTDSYLPLIFEYDAKLIGYDRKLALELNFKETDSKTIVAISKGVCVGFGTIKMCCQGNGLVGPLYADCKDIAEVILRRLVIALPQAKGFAMMTCSSNVHAVEFLKKIGCPKLADCERLYRKEKVNVDISKVFAQFDLNFQPY